MISVGDLVKFFDYDECAANRYQNTHDDYWRIGIVTEIRHEPWDEDWDPACCPYPVIYHDCHVQPIVMPNENNIGTWVEVIK